MGNVCYYVFMFPENKPVDTLSGNYERSEGEIPLPCVIEQVSGTATTYRRIRNVSNTQSKQSREYFTLRRTSLVGLIHIPMLVSALNSTIVFLF